MTDAPELIWIDCDFINGGHITYAFDRDYSGKGGGPADDTELEEYVRADLHAEAIKAAEQRGYAQAVEDAARVIAGLEDDYGEFAAIVALDKASEHISALSPTPADQSADTGETDD